MKTYTLEPQDLLFFRDGRPIETSGGHGARWPEPSVIFDALHAALHRAFPEAQPWEHSHRLGRGSARDMRRQPTQRFGSLATTGIFPVWTDGRWLFPAPADATASTDPRDWLLRPMATSLDQAVPSGSSAPHSNLPAPLRHLVANFSLPTKDTAPPWWSATAWQNYLAGKPPAPAELFTSDDLFAGEWTTGIGIDPETQTQDGQRLYSAEYLRLRPNVRCGFTASLRVKQNGNGNDVRECIGELFKTSQTIIVGGQQRACRVEPCPPSPLLPLPRGLADGFNTHGEGNAKRWLIKWVLLSPAVWPAIQANESKGIVAHPGGWLPNWIAPADSYVVLQGDSKVTVSGGQVLLKAEAPRGEHESREAWRERVRQADFIAAHLVAACVPKPVPITGWTERLHLLKDEPHWGQEGGAHGPRQSHLAVPAGAVYYFEANSPEDAAKLAAALNWHRGAESEIRNPKSEIRLNRRSTLMGEKGFGLGVCGAWDAHPGSTET